MTEERSEKKDINELEGILKQKQYDRALAQALELIKLYPDSFQIKILSSEIYTFLNNFTEAERCLNELIMIYPENINVLLKLAEIKDKLGKGGESVDYYKKVLFLDPFNTVAKEKIEKTSEVDSQPEAAKIESAQMPGEESEPETEDIQEESVPVEEPPDQPESDLDFDTQDEERDLQTLAINGDDESITRDKEELVKESMAELMEIPEAEDSNKNIESISKIDSVLEDIAKSSEEENPVVSGAEIEPEVMEENFYTESAAELYQEQKLYDEAILVYEKLLQTDKDNQAYMQKIKDLKKQKTHNSTVKKLQKFKELLSRGEDLV